MMFWKKSKPLDLQPSLEVLEAASLLVLEDAKTELAQCKANYRALQRQHDVVVNAFGNIVFAALTDGADRAELERQVRDLVERQTKAEVAFHHALSRFSGIAVRREAERSNKNATNDQSAVERD